MRSVGYDAIIIGGGACGLMCAAQAGLLGKKTLILERNDKVGAKILISGGGRCNYTNLYTSPDNFVSENPKFLNSIFSRWSVEDTIRFFENFGKLKGEEKTLGQLFPRSNKAKDVVTTFTNLLHDTGQKIELRAKVNEVIHKDGVFSIQYEKDGETYKIQAPKVVVAPGGLPVHQLGASDLGLQIAKHFGMRIVPTFPALVPLTITGKESAWYTALSGTSIFAKVSNNKVSFEENILFTHWGLSGPAILQISSYWQAGESLAIDLLPNKRIENLIQIERDSGGKRTLGHLLSSYFTKRFTDALSEFLPTNIKIASLSKKDAKSCVDFIHNFKVKPAGDKGYQKAEVMRGGVATNDLKNHNLESKVVDGLYFGGEAVDITGWLGGYNFQWAWAAGFVIAQDL